MAKRSDLFIRLSLDYANHPKIASLSDAAFRAHVEMILYSRKYETDGIIKNRIANRVGSGWDTEVLTELLTNDEEAPSLLQLDNGDYELHGYADMQETREEIAARRRKNADNGKRGGRPRNPNKTQSVTDSAPQPQTQSGTQTKAETETETETEVSTPSLHVASDDNAKKPKTADDFPEEAVELCNHLADLIKTNGNRVGKVGVEWWQAMDRLIRLDDYTPEQVRQVIDWCQQDEFWQGNILSAKKLRQKFDTLKARMFADRGKPSGPPQQFQSAAERRYEAGANLVADELNDWKQQLGELTQ